MNLDNLYKKNDSLFKNEQRNLKAKIFIQIFEKVLKYYEENLKELNVIDFDDMINNSTSYINNDKIKTPYKYILIDEFQDI
jgi:DNA helicase-4